MKKLVGVGVVVLALILIMSGLSFARSMAFTDAECLIFRDTSGDELKLCGAVDITAGTITYTTGSGAPVTTTGTETLTNKTLTSPIIQLGTDAQVYVASVSGVLNAVTMSSDVTITNTGVATVGKVENTDVDFATVTDGFLQVATNAGSGSWDAVAMSGDATITNAGVISVGANKIGTAEAFVNTLTIDFWPAQTSNTATVTAGSTILGVYAFANVDAEVANIAAISGSTLTLTLQAAAANAISLFKVVVLEP